MLAVRRFPNVSPTFRARAAWGDRASGPDPGSRGRCARWARPGCGTVAGRGGAGLL